MQTLVKHWGIETDLCTELTHTTYKIGEKYILKKYSDTFTLEMNIGIAKALRQVEFPTFKLMLTLDGETYLTVNENYYILYEAIKGEHITIQAVMDDDEKSYQIGQVIGKLHQGLAQIENDFKFYENNFLEEFNGWIKATIMGSGNTYYATELLNQYAVRLGETYPLLHRQPIHRDVHLGNMLFCEQQLVGYIDFDISQINARIFDIAYMGTGALAAIFDDLEYREKWHNYFESMLAGYEAIVSLSQLERDSIAMMMEAIEILFVAYFITQNDLELAKKTDEVLYWLKHNGQNIGTQAAKEWEL